MVINHGRSVVQAPIDELTSGEAAGMRIAGPDAGKLDRLRSEGATVEPGSDGSFVITGKQGEEIGRLAAEDRW